MSKEAFGLCPGQGRCGGEKPRSNAPQTNPRRLPGAGGGGGGQPRGELRARRTVLTSHTCQPSCAQQRLEVSAPPSMTSPPKVKIGLSAPTRVRVTGVTGGGEREKMGSATPTSVCGEAEIGFGRRHSAFPEHHCAEPQAEHSAHFTKEETVRGVGPFPKSHTPR